jgi:hypothetical protein
MDQSEQLTFFAEALPANHSQSPDFEQDWLTRVAISCLPLEQLLMQLGPNGWYGRTSPEFCTLTEGEILEPSSGCYQNSGMGSPTKFMTLNTLDWPSDASVCSLSDILETGDVPQQYYLSATACLGILRRAEKRGKTLPPLLQQALEASAEKKEVA